MFTCPPEETFVLALQGELDPLTATTFHKHVELCGACAALLRAMSSAPQVAATATTHATMAPPGVASAEIGPGTRIHQYELIRELGRGGMGMVWAARDTKLGRRVAMKFLLNAARGIAERFLVEARATAHCSHDNIVIIHEVDEIGDTPYMVLEFLEGQTLREVIASYGPSARLPPSRVVELVLPIARALARAHELGIVHRDLKPDNVFVTTAGQVKVLDFGIAKALGAAEHIRSDGKGGGLQETRHGTLMGTVPYMSPEQMGVDEVDHRADLWAVGIMLFEMLAGRHPVEERTVEGLFTSVTSDEPLTSIAEVVPELPDGLAAIVDGCLRKRKADRGGDLVAKLEALLPGRRGRALDEGESPFPGLTAFDEGDADRFFGRTNEIVRMTARIRERPITGVVGPSGAGKSSFVRAGVGPALKASGEHWDVISLRPGRQPFAALANALRPLATTLDPDRLRAEAGHAGELLRARARQTGSRILVFVDQLEELYTLVPKAKERLAFTGVLVALADDPATPVRVVLSMRSDFLDRVAEDPRLMEELGRGLVFLPPPDGDALRDALRAPVELVGHHYERATIVDDMVDALAGTPGALPLLQFAAAKLWEARDRKLRLLTVASYTAIGGLSGALATHADEVVGLMSAPARKLTQKIFRHLVTPERTRAIVELEDLVALAPERVEGMRVIDQLVAARLLVIQKRDAGGSVEIVHESLIERWPMLRRWLDDDEEDAAYLAQLAAAAKQWDGKGRPAGLLWRGEAMDDARRWFALRPRDLGERDRAFLDAVFKLARRGQRLRRGGIAGAFAVVVAIAIGASVAYVRVSRAEQDALASEATAKENLAKADEKERLRIAADQQREAARQGQREAEKQTAQEHAAATTATKAFTDEREDKERKLGEDLVRLEDEKKVAEHEKKVAEDEKKVAEAKTREAEAARARAEAAEALAQKELERERQQKAKSRELVTGKLKE